MKLHLKKALLLKLALISFATLILFISFYSKNSLLSDFRINEVSFTNNDGNDWIEIYNAGFNTRSLKGLYLTDDKEKFTKYEIKENIIVPPKGFVVIYGKDYKGEDLQDALIANFGIKNGETIYLIGRTQEIIDSFTVLTSEDSTETTTIGRFPDGNDDTFLMSTPTKGKENQKDMIFEFMPQK